MAIEIYQDDDATLVAEFPIPGFEAGVDSTPFTVHIWNNKGNSFDQAAANASLALYVEHLTTSGLFVRSGFPPVDEMWARFRIVGFAAPGDPTFTVANTPYKPVGANAVLDLADLPSNVAIYVEILFHPPSTAGNVPYRFGLGVLKDDFSIAAAPGLSKVDRGILPLVGDFAETEILLGGTLAANGTPNATVQISAVQAVVAGLLRGAIKTSLTPDQTDGAAAALTVGQSYYAAISYGPSGWVATKGLRATSPVRPAVPAGGRLRGYVKVDYQAGTSVIEAADIENAGLYGRYYAEAGTGLELKIHRGRAIGGGTERFAHGFLLVVLPASTTSYVSQVATGLFDVEPTNVVPEETALGPWYEVDTGAAAVTAIRDRRTYAGRTRMITLKGALPGSAGFVDDLVVQEERLFVEEVLFCASTNGGGSAGFTQADVQKNGTTIFTSNATEDHRPKVAFDATVLQAATRFHEVTELRRGDVLSFATVAHPTGGTPPRGEVSLLCRVP